jgi:signal transduction histidine kinase
MIAYGLTYREYLELKVLERDAAAARLEQDRAELLATVAHELRSPLSAAMGTIDLANRHLSRGQVDRLPPLLGTARDALVRLSRLTANLARATDGHAAPLSPAPQDLRALLADAVAWIAPAAAEKGIELAWGAGPPSVALVGDADALLSVLGNLLSNAVRYTPAGGRIVVGCGVGDGEAWAEVADTGIGIAPEVQARIFEKFYRAREARDVEAQGLGLGLALVKDLVLAHGGRVEVRSAPGEGSAFRVVLPQGGGPGEEGKDGAGN